MSGLYNQIKEGTWTWPNDINICLNTFDFMNRTMQHEPSHRPSWQEMLVHPIFTEKAQSRDNKIKLDIIFDQAP